jgi:hypothetical protein
MRIVVVVVEPAFKANGNTTLRTNLGVERAKILGALDTVLVTFARTTWLRALHEADANAEWRGRQAIESR